MLTRILAIVCCCLCTTTVLASEQFQLSIANWQIEQAQLKNVQIGVVLERQGIVLEATATSIDLPAPIGRLNTVKLRCQKLKLSISRFDCQQGVLHFKHAALGQQTIQFKADADNDSGSYRILTSGLSIATSKVKLEVDIQQQQWRLLLKAPETASKHIAQFISPHLSQKQQQVMATWQQAGNIAFTINAAGHGDIIDSATINLSLKQFTVSDHAGQYATEGVEAKVSLVLQQQKSRWQWQAYLSAKHGQAYVAPIFIDFDDTAVTLDGRGSWHVLQSQLKVAALQFIQQGVLEARADLALSMGEVDRLNVDIRPTALAGLYRHWLQPFSLGSAVDNLAITGEASLSYQQQAQAYQLQLGLMNVSIEDDRDRFRLTGLSGDLAWTNQDVQLPFTLHWQSAAIYKIPIGSTALSAQTQAEGLTLLKPWHIPILDGQLNIQHFALQNKMGESTNWVFEGLLTPISMAALSQKLAWPTLHGKLSGVIPKVTYAQQHINVDGALMIKLFEGTTIIHDLRLRDPFGAIPQLYANIDLIDFDLETMTETFDFGKITGKLEGKVQNLRLANWRPVAFDAYIRTPTDDKTRHRISQRAINNLSELGGGTSGLLSRSVLRFFDDFSYQRLGLSCRLLNEVCDMTGVEETEQGYYIVKGGGLPPRINVKGFTRRVDWPVLVSRLKAVSRSAEPVVE